MIVAHISDTHLGYSTGTLGPLRSRDFLYSWLEACKSIVKESPDLIIHSGDLFHHPRPTWAAVSAAIQGFNLLAGTAPVVCIAGNHDLAKLRTDQTVFTVLDHACPGVHFIWGDAATEVRYPGQRAYSVWAVPHGALVANDWDSFPEGDHLRHILVSHGDVEAGRVKSYELGSVSIPADLLKPPWAYVALGHIHAGYQVTGSAWYAGSTERCGWSDYPASPSWLRVEINPGQQWPKVQRVPIPFRPFIDMPPIDVEDLTARNLQPQLYEELAKHKNPEAVFRVHLRGATRALAGALAYDLRRTTKDVAFGVSVTVDSGPEYSPRDGRENPYQVGSVSDMFRAFVEGRKEEGDGFWDDLLERGLGLLATVEAQIEKETAEDGS